MQHTQGAIMQHYIRPTVGMLLHVGGRYDKVLIITQIEDFTEPLDEHPHLYVHCFDGERTIRAPWTFAPHLQLRGRYNKDITILSHTA